MKKLIVGIITIGFLGIANSSFAQKYFTKEGSISFYSEAPMEKIEAFNKNATSVLDIQSGKMEFAVLIKGFHFEKALMEEHFNENYMESSKFPKSTFKGEITNLSEVNFSTDGKYKVNVKGNLTIHGETNPVETTGTLMVDGGKIIASSVFKVTVADYKIEIPKLVRENIAKEVDITVDLNYQLLEQ